MKIIESIPQKVHHLESLLRKVAIWRFAGKSIAFTNGVFDILHEGHLTSICQAASFADVLIVGINADASVKRLKGPTRPITNEHGRLLLMAAMQVTDAVVLFAEDTPIELIRAIMPDVLVKGGDYTIEQIIGAKEVLANGGKVEIVPILEGFSTTSIIERCK